MIVFRDQTLATVAESARIKYAVGPTIAWYQDFLRYYFLTVEDSVDGSLTRRFSVLMLLLCLFGMIAVLLRRGSLPGMASGPVWRLIGTTRRRPAAADVHADEVGRAVRRVRGLGGALGAVTAFTFSRVGLHSRRNLALYVTALLFVLAWATSGINGWFYVGNYGVPWFDKQPVIAEPPGHRRCSWRWRSSPGLLAGWLHFRMDYAGHTEVANTRRNRVLASTPLLVVATIMVLLEVGVDGQGRRRALPRVHHRQGQRRRPLASGSVGRPAARWPTTCSSNPTPTPGCCNRFRASASVPTARSAGATRSASPRTASATPSNRPSPSPPTPAPSTPTARRTSRTSASASRRAPAAATAPSGVNGSRVFLPFGLDPARTPVMGSYEREHPVAAKATSAWYQLPPRTPDRPLVTVAAAGAIWSYDEDGNFNYGQSLKLQWGVQRPDGTLPGAGRGAADRHRARQKAWRNLRFPLAWAPPEANVARIVADDPNLSDRPVVRVHPAAGAGPADRAAVPRLARRRC